MGVKIFVGNLPFSVGDDKLKAEFLKFGEIESAEVVKDKRSGRSSGYGFVVFCDRTGAEAAIEGMNGQPVDGRNLTVNMGKNQG